MKTRSLLIECDSNGLCPGDVIVDATDCNVKISGLIGRFVIAIIQNYKDDWSSVWVLCKQFGIRHTKLWKDDKFRVLRCPSS